MPIEQVKLDLIDDNPYQPRSSYPGAKVAELAASIQQNGLLETPVARRKGDRVQLAFGHLRKRAFKFLNEDEGGERWAQMPLDIRDLNDDQMAVFALEENLKRFELKPIDVARAIDKFLTDSPGVTETQMAKDLGMTQGAISNMRRVLRLPKEVLDKVDAFRINFAMARELLVLLGLSAPSPWEGKVQDDKGLMLEAIRGTRGEGQGGFGHPCTREGMLVAIYDVAHRYLKGLEGEYSQYQSSPLFDTRAAGCLKCEHMIITHPTKSQTAHFCTDFTCWDKKQEEHKKAAAAEATAKMQKDIITRATAAQVATEVKTRKVTVQELVIEVDQALFAQIRASASPDRIQEDQPVRKPFSFEDKVYVSTGTALGTKPIASAEEAYLLVPREEYKDQVRTYRVPEGRQYDEYYESLRNDPNGFYHGMLVKRGKSEAVLVGPPVIFALQGISQEITPVVGRVVEAEETILIAPTTDERDPRTAETAITDATVFDWALSDSEITLMFQLGPVELTHARDRIKQLKDMPADYPCKTCLNIGRCDGTKVIAKDEGGFECAEVLTKGTKQELLKKAMMKIPPELEALAREKAGTRAEILDLHEISLGNIYNKELKQGFSQLNEDSLGRLADPLECMDRCTTGFHYAFDPRDASPKTIYVCTNSHCLTQKKAAYTRAKNAAGMAKKKAEEAAIKQAVNQTMLLDLPRVKLLILVLLEAHKGGPWMTEYNSARKWFWKRLGLGKDIADDILFDTIGKLGAQDLNQLVVEFCLHSLQYRGELESYKVETIQALNWMGIGVNVKPNEEDPEVSC